MRTPLFILLVFSAVACSEDNASNRDANQGADLSGADAGMDVADVLGGDQVADGGDDLDATGPASIRFELGGRPYDYGDVPFPSDLYRDGNGRIELGAWPSPKDESPFYDALRALLTTRSGFCTTCAVTFVVDGEIDTRTLPTAAEPGSVASLDDSVVVVDVSDTTAPLSPVPLDIYYDNGRLSVRPSRGHTLSRERVYAAFVTRAVRDQDGEPLVPSADLVRVLSGDSSLDPTVHDIHGPVLDRLSSEGIAHDQIVGLTVFTTGDPSRGPIALRSAVRAVPASAPSVDSVHCGASVDELLGVPDEDLPGVDQAPGPGTDGTRAIRHATTSCVILGSFEAPRFVSGEGTDVGLLPLDEGDGPRPLATDAVPFVLIVPENADLSALPVVVSHHGFNASRTTAFVLADTVGAAGYAVLGIDAYQHGDRASSAVDVAQMLRGLETGDGDGFAETNQLDVSARVFGLAGVEPGLEFHVGYPLSAFSQFAADAMSAIHVLENGDWSNIAAALGEPALVFDASRIAYVGNSMGAVVGAQVLTAEPSVSAAVLNVLPGSIVETLAESGEFWILVETVILPLLQVRASEPRAALFDPTVELMRWALEPVDPLSLAPFLARERVISTAPDLLIQLAGHDEVAPPTAAMSVVSAASIGGRGEFIFAPVAGIDFPVAGNGVGGQTVAAEVFPGSMHGMLEVNEQLSIWESPLEPPLAARPEPMTLVNPTSFIHTQIESFLRTHSETGLATIE